MMCLHVSPTHHSSAKPVHEMKNELGRRRGRPSSYNPERGDEIIAIMRQGYTATAAAASIGVSRLALYRWSAAHPEFRYAFGLAKGLYSLHWEQKLLTVTNAATAKACIAALKNTDEFRASPVRQRV
jgi:Helix-turn-helix domain of resolvase